MPIDLSSLAALAQRLPDLAEVPVDPFVVAGQALDGDQRPILMGTLNLSPDSTYRESVALDVDTALRLGCVQRAQGADFVDVGAESSDDAAERVDAAGQNARLEPVIRGLVERGVPVSVECYHPRVAERALEAGACVLNLTGSTDDATIFAMAADAGASVIICSAPSGTVRDDALADHEREPFTRALDHLRPRLELAREAGVPSISVDPGIGFFYGDLTDPDVRIRYQTGVLLGTARLRVLGAPICHALPHAFSVFGDEFRTAEGFFTVAALLGGTGILRIHEVSRVRAVVEAMSVLESDPWSH